MLIECPVFSTSLSCATFLLDLLVYMRLKGTFRQAPCVFMRAYVYRARFQPSILSYIHKQTSLPLVPIHEWLKKGRGEA
jgi:hypothetical protein